MNDQLDKFDRYMLRMVDVGRVNYHAHTGRWLFDLEGIQDSDRPEILNHLYELGLISRPQDLSRGTAVTPTALGKDVVRSFPVESQ